MTGGISYLYITTDRYSRGGQEEKKPRDWRECGGVGRRADGDSDASNRTLISLFEIEKVIRRFCFGEKKKLDS